VAERRRADRRRLPSAPSHPDRGVDPASATAWSVPSPDVALALMILGVGVALAVMLPGALAGESLTFMRTPLAMVYVGVIAVQFGVWAIITVPLLNVAQRHWRAKRLRHRVRAVAVAAGALALIAVPVILSPTAETKLRGEAVRSDVIGCIGALVLFLDVLGIALVYFVAREELPGVSGTTPDEWDDARRKALHLYRGLHSDLHRLVMAMGIMAALAVLSAAALELALTSSLGHQPANFPASAIAYWGLYGAAVVAIVTLPYHFALRGNAHSIRETYYPSILPGETGYEERRRQRLEVNEFLGLNAFTLDTARTSVAVLAPLVSGLLPLLSLSSHQL
jgi:hypothetical protein